MQVPNEFNIEKQFEFYLSMAYKNKVDKIPLAQRTELRRCFHMAYAIQLINMRDRMPEDDDAGVAILEDMLRQVSNFLTVEVLNAILNKN